MNDQLTVRLDRAPSSVESHKYECTLSFNGSVIWGPVTCHENTRDLQYAIHKADDRFDLSLTRKDLTVEGHTRCISVISEGETLLDRTSTHENMTGLVTAINDALMGST